LEKHLTRVKSGRPHPLIRGVWVRRNTYAYLLTETGIRYAHQMLGIEAKVVTMEAQMNHTLGLNAILMRYLRTHGFDGVRWFNTREAADELWFLRKLATGQADTDLRATAIRPDAILRTSTGFWWIEYDNATENSRQIRHKYQMYVTNLAPLDASFRQVVWVTKNETRQRILETIWNRMDNKDIDMRFYVESHEPFLSTDAVG
ncbi:MAG: replication-relaxation family protein, partial [Alicyclobacillus sp.]|nr:replication-relaxation family protein [Alicyclobacillus sp.]